MSYGSNDDDRPQRRRSRHRRRRRGPGVGVWVSLACLALLIVVGGVVAVVASRKGGRDGAGGTPGTDVARVSASGKASPPSGWKEYTYADAGFKAYFPSEPRRVSDESIGMLGEAGGRGLMIEYTAHSFEDGSALTAWVYTRRVPPHIPPEKAREIIYKQFDDPARFPIVGERLIDSRTVTWMGHKVQEFRVGLPENVKRGKGVVMIQRCVVTDTYEVHAEISMEDGRKLTSRLIDGFFDNIQPLK